MYVEIVNKFIFIEVYVSNESLYNTRLWMVRYRNWSLYKMIESFAWAAVCFQIIISTVEVMTLSQTQLDKAYSFFLNM